MGVKCDQHSGFDARLENLEIDNRDQWTAINQIRNRLPVWATLVMTLMGTVLGITGTVAVLSGKLAAVAGSVLWFKDFWC